MYTVSANLNLTASEGNKSQVAFSACVLQCFHAVGWAAGRASGL